MLNIGCSCHRIRWLSRAACVNRLLTCYPALLQYFQDESSAEVQKKNNGRTKRTASPGPATEIYELLT